MVAQEVEFFAESWVTFYHDAFRMVGQILVDFFRNERYKWVQKFQNLVQCVHQYGKGITTSNFLCTVQNWFCQLDVPIAELAPNKVEQCLASHTKFVLFHKFGNGFDCLVEFCQNPLVRQREFCLANIHKLFVFAVHKNKTACVPNLVHKVASAVNLVGTKTHVATICNTVDERKTKCICAVLVDKLNWVNTVAQRFTHLATLFVTYDTVHQNVLKWDATCVVQGTENHTSNPEEDDVVATSKYACWEERVVVVGAYATKCGEGPKCATEPSVENVLVLVDVCATAMWTTCWIRFLADFRTTIGAVPNWDTVSPPKLTRNTPVADVFHPVEVGVFVAFWVEGDVAIFNCRQSRLSKWLHLYKPLFGNNWLNSCVTTVATANVVCVWNNLLQNAHFLQFCNNLLARFVAVEAGKLPCKFVHCAVVVHNADNWQVVALAHFEVVRVVRRSDFYNACTKFHINVLVGNNGDFAVDKGHYHSFANKVCVAWVVGVNCNGCVAQHCFRTGGCKGNCFASVWCTVSIVPEETILFSILYFGITKSSFANWTPVDDAVTTVNQAIVVHFYKCLSYFLGALFVHGKCKTGPVATATQGFELLDNSATVLRFPLPCLFQEAFASQVALVDALFFQVFHNFNFGSDTCVVGTGEPQCVETLHTLEANKRVLDGVVKAVAKVQLTCDVWWRSNHREVWLTGLCFGCEVALLHPPLVEIFFE